MVLSETHCMSPWAWSLLLPPGCYDTTPEHALPRPSPAIHSIFHFLLNLPTSHAHNSTCFVVDVQSLSVPL